MATWPTTLPAPLLDGYSLQTTDATIRTDMEGGPARVRRRFTAAPDRIKLDFLFTTAQMVTFRNFWDASALGGAAWFFMTLRDGRTATSASKEVRPTSGTFQAAMTTGGDNALWRVSFEVEVRNA